MSATVDAASDQEDCGLIGDRVLSTRTEIAVSARNLRNADILSLSDPICVLWVKEIEAQKWREYGRTEEIKDNLNPEWVKKFHIDYYFEETQYLRFEIYDIDSKSNDLKKHDPLGCAECTLADLVANLDFTLDLREMKSGKAAKGQLIVKAEELSSCKEVTTLQWKAYDIEKTSKFKKPRLYFEISKENHDASWTPVWRSNKQSGTEVTWPEFRIHVTDICNGEDDRSLRFRLFDESRLVGEFYTYWRNISRGAGHQNTYELTNPEKKKKSSKPKNFGFMQLTAKASTQENTFMDYIKTGMQIQVTVAIDFTRSNGDPKQKDSLHSLTSDNPNPYTRAIQSVVSILEHYDTDKMIPVYGFGARLQAHDPHASMMFPLNQNVAHPSCFRVNGVLEEYHGALKRVILDGPTYFSPIINHVTRQAAKDTSGKEYHVLLIITDGVIDDMPKTMQAVIEASKYPISIIIVGVGKQNFKAMEKLDSDHKLLSYNKLTAERDIVQFVALRDFEQENQAIKSVTSEKQLRYEVLREMPDQIISYMGQHRIFPNRLRPSSYRI